MKILIVDDSVFMRNMIKNILRDGNHVFKEAGNYDEALAAFREMRPDLTFLDIVLPGKNGMEVLKAIKSLDPNANVVMCTSMGGQQEVVDEAVRAGASDFIVKPFKPEDILNAVSRFQA